MLWQLLQASCCRLTSHHGRDHPEHEEQGEEGESQGDEEGKSFLFPWKSQRKNFGSINNSFLNLKETNQLFHQASWYAIGCYVLLLLLVYSMTPNEDLVYLNGTERRAAIMAASVLAFTTLLLLIPFVLFWHREAHHQDQDHDEEERPKKSLPYEMSAVVHAALLVQGIAIFTNLLLAFCPVPVRIDVVTHSPVYVIRWCEWIPLSGFMTFLSEGIFIPRHAKQQAINVSLTQTLSCLTGGLFCAYCSSTWSWSFNMILSFLTWGVMFPRCLQKRQIYHQALHGGPHIDDDYTLPSRETFDRLRFSYHLFLSCTVVWTLLVVMYCANWYLHRCCDYDDESHPIREMMLESAPAMAVDTIFDVTAKGLYMKCIFDVHFAVFDAEAMAMNQLSELRNLMSVLWDKNSDVIVISVCQEDRMIAMLSPAFQSLIGIPNATNTTSTNTTSTTNQDTTTSSVVETSSDPTIGSRRPALMLHLVKETNKENPQRGEEWADGVIKAHYIQHSTKVLYHGWMDHVLLKDVVVPPEVSQKARSIVMAAWNRTLDGTPNGTSSTYSFETLKGESRKSEMNVSKHGRDATISIVRDVTERYRRFDAERRAHVEAMRRQKESQSQTRFVRHEVKNGLLAGIELCDGLHDEIDAAMQTIQNALSTLNNAAAYADDASPPLNMGMTRAASAVAALPRGLSAGSMGSSASLDPGLLLSAVQAHANAATGNATWASTPADQEQSNQNVLKAKAHIENLDMLLHEVLDTVLAEAFARDVVNEIYRPRSESLDVVSVLNNYVGRKRSSDGKCNRFQVSVQGGADNFPFLHLDPQLLRYIHRNAVSNAVKYGKVGGKVETILSFDASKKLFQMEVINEPGPNQDQVMELGDDLANEIVFAQGSTLHDASPSARRDSGGGGDAVLSSGDGAWIMKKCAKTMGGNCSIRFFTDKTVFSFVVPAEPLAVSKIPESKNFVVPENTIGVAIDDAKIQRKLMGRILSHVGVKPDMSYVVGETPGEIMGLRDLLRKLLVKHPESKILVLVDENLDYRVKSNGGEDILLSGSLIMQNIILDLSIEQRERVLTLVRSANDSAEDVALYTERTDGFFPKAPMQKDRVREILAPMWAEKFWRKPERTKGSKRLAPSPWLSSCDIPTPNITIDGSASRFAKRSRRTNDNSIIPNNHDDNKDTLSTKKRSLLASSNSSSASESLMPKTTTCARAPFSNSKEEETSEGKRMNLAPVAKRPKSG